MLFSSYMVCKTFCIAHPQNRTIRDIELVTQDCVDFRIGLIIIELEDENVIGARIGNEGNNIRILRNQNSRPLALQNEGLTKCMGHANPG